MVGLGDGAGGGDGGGVGGGGGWELQQRHGRLLKDNEAISRAWECLLLWRISILGWAFEQERGKKKRKRKGFQEVQVTYNIKIHSSYEIKDLVDTDVRNIVCDPPIAPINHLCRGLLYARCWV